MACRLAARARTVIDRVHTYTHTSIELEEACARLLACCPRPNRPYRSSSLRLECFSRIADDPIQNALLAKLMWRQESWRQVTYRFNVPPALIPGRICVYCSIGLNASPNARCELLLLYTYICGAYLLTDRLPSREFFFAARKYISVFVDRAVTYIISDSSLHVATGSMCDAIVADCEVRA